MLENPFAFFFELWFVVVGEILAEKFSLGLVDHDRPRIADIRAINPVKNDEHQRTGASTHHRSKLRVFENFIVEFSEEPLDALRQFGGNRFAI